MLRVGNKGGVSKGAKAVASRRLQKVPLLKKEKQKQIRSELLTMTERRRFA